MAAWYRSISELKISCTATPAAYNRYVHRLNELPTPATYRECIDCMKKKCRYYRLSYNLHFILVYQYSKRKIMSKLTFDIIPAAPRGDIIGLQTVISKLDDHLRSTNEKLGNLRKLIRTETNIKSRDIYLNKVCDMVKEQHRIKSILHNYRSKLKKLESIKKLVRINS